MHAKKHVRRRGARKEKTCQFPPGFLVFLSPLLSIVTLQSNITYTHTHRPLHRAPAAKSGRAKEKRPKKRVLGLSNGGQTADEVMVDLDALQSSSSLLPKLQP
jgi:hypothetical protein